MSRRSDCGFSHPLAHGDWRMIPRSLAGGQILIARSDRSLAIGAVIGISNSGKGGRKRDRMQRRETVATVLLSHMGFSRINRHKNFRFLSVLWIRSEDRLRLWITTSFLPLLPAFFSPFLLHPAVRFWGRFVCPRSSHSCSRSSLPDSQRFIEFVFHR